MYKKSDENKNEKVKQKKDRLLKKHIKTSLGLNDPKMERLVEHTLTTVDIVKALIYFTVKIKLNKLTSLPFMVNILSS